MDSWKWNVSALCALLFAMPVCAAATSPLPVHVQRAAVRVLESDSISLHGAKLAKFIRFDATGSIETFECETMAALELTRNRSGEAGGVTFGQCERNSSLNENMGTEQLKNYQAAVAAAKATGQMLVEAVKATDVGAKSNIVREQGASFIQLSQLLIPGVGGTRGGMGYVDTMLLIPETGSKVILVQANLGDRACESLDDAPKPPACKSTGTLRDVARQVSIALAGPVPEPPFKLEPISPGRRTMCDSIAFAVAMALVESDERHLAVMETRFYNRHAGQPEIQTPMRLAGVEHAQGASISTAAMNAGRQCYEKSLEKK